MFPSKIIVFEGGFVLTFMFGSVRSHTRQHNPPPPAETWNQTRACWCGLILLEGPRFIECIEGIFPLAAARSQKSHRSPVQIPFTQGAASNNRRFQQPKKDRNLGNLQIMRQIHRSSWIIIIYSIGIYFPGYKLSIFLGPPYFQYAGPCPPQKRNVAFSFTMIDDIHSIISRFQTASVSGLL